jgi:hypothetical protein
VGVSSQELRASSAGELDQHPSLVTGMHVLIALFFASVTAILAWSSGRLLWTGLRGSLRTAGWRRTVGTVVRADVLDGDPLVLVQARRARRLDVEVEYEVDGARYTTGRVSALGRPEDLFYAGPTLARLRRRFARGARVPVHYDPASPGDALLLRAEWGKLAVGGFFTLLFATAVPLILWTGITVFEPTRLRESNARQALARQAPVVLAYLDAHPELGRPQHVRGFSQGGPHGHPPTTAGGDWTFDVETTLGYQRLRATRGRIVEVTRWENPSGDPAWLLSLRRRLGW